MLNLNKFSVQQRAAIELAFVSIYCGLAQNCAILHWCMCGHLKHEQSQWHLVSDLAMVISLIALMISTPSYLPKAAKILRRYLILIVAASPASFLIQFSSNVRMRLFESVSQTFVFIFSSVSIIASIILIGLSFYFLLRVLKANGEVIDDKISTNDELTIKMPKLSTFLKAALGISIAVNLWLANDLIGKSRKIQYLSIQTEVGEHLLSDSLAVFDTAIGLKGIESIKDAQRLWGPPEQIRFYHEYETYKTLYEKCNDGIELKYGDIRAIFDCNEKLIKIREWTGTGWMTLKSNTI